MTAVRPVAKGLIFVGSRGLFVGGCRLYIGKRRHLERRRDLSDEGTLGVFTLEPRKGSTPYMNYANKPVIGFCLLILGVFWIRGRIGN